MIARKASALFAAALAVWSGLAVAQSDDLKAPLTARVSFAALDGEPVLAARPAEPLRLRVALQSSVASEAPAGLTLFGWLRRVDPEGTSCGVAAEAFMRTGRLPVGTMFLNDPVIGVVTQDAGFAVSDPDFSLATANILGATELPEQPASLVTDPQARRFLLSLPQRGEVLAIDATAGKTVLARGLKSPELAVPGARGAVLVHERAGPVLHVAPGEEPQEILSGVSRLIATQAAGWSVALSGDHAMLLRTDGASVKVDLKIHSPGLRDAAALVHFDDARPFALALLGNTGVSLHYLDAPDRPVQVALPYPAERLAAAPDGRVALAWKPSTTSPVQVIDIARSRVVQTSLAQEPVMEVAFSDSTAFVMLESQTHVGALDLLAVARGQRAEFREIQIGTAAPAPGTQGRRQLLAPLWPMEGMLAVHAPSYQGYRIMDGSVMGDAPAMTATSLRGGVPQMVATLDRSFVEVELGVFETVTSLPGRGRFELVATTGLGGISFCSEVPVAFPEIGKAPDVGTIYPEETADGHRFALRTGDDKPAAGMTGRVVFSALQGSWKAVAQMQTDAEGRSLQRYRLPDVPGIVVMFETAGLRFAPLILEEGL